MTVYKNRRPAAVRGRHQDKSRDALIIQATEEMLGQSGYEGLTMSGVAKRAGVSKSTLYRRWATKQELVADVLNGLGWITNKRREGDSIRQDLLEIMWHAGGATGRHHLTAIVLQTARSEPDLGAILRDRFITSLRNELNDLIQRSRDAEQCGVSEKSAEYVIETATALLFYSAGQTGTHIERDRVSEIVDHVLLPLICRTE